MDAPVSDAPIFSSVPVTFPEVFASVYSTQCPSRFLSGELVFVMEILIGGENDTPTCYILKTLRSRFGHFTANGKPWFACNGFKLPVCPHLELKFRGW